MRRLRGVDCVVSSERAASIIHGCGMPKESSGHKARLEGPEDNLGVGAFILNGGGSHWWLLKLPCLVFLRPLPSPGAPLTFSWLPSHPCEEGGTHQGRRSSIPSLGLSVPVLLRALSSPPWCLQVAGRDMTWQAPSQPRKRCRLVSGKSSVPRFHRVSCQLLVVMAMVVCACALSSCMEVPVTQSCRQDGISAAGALLGAKCHGQFTGGANSLGPPSWRLL